MSDSFLGTGNIYLQPGDTSVPYRFRLTVASSSTLSNGSLPYNSSVCSQSVSIHQRNGSSVGTSDLIVASTEDGNTLVVKLGHSTAATKGLHHMQWTVTCSVAGSTLAPMKKEVEFNRLWIKDK